MNNESIYPQEGESWTSITEEALLDSGFEKDYDTFALDHLVCYYHPKCLELRVVPTITRTWMIYLSGQSCRLRDVRYMYQIDNMFHGFTDRWLGYI